MIEIISPQGHDAYYEVLSTMLKSEGYDLCQDGKIKIIILGDEEPSAVALENNCIIVHHDYEKMNSFLSGFMQNITIQKDTDWRSENITLKDNKNTSLLIDFNTNFEKGIISTDKTSICVQLDQIPGKLIILDFLTIGRKLLSGLSHIGRKKSLLDIPLFNVYSSLLSEIIELVAKKQNIPLVKKQLWPDKYEYAVALTHDIERIFPSPKNYIDRLRKKLTQETSVSPLDQFETFQTIENKHDVKSTHFFLDNTSFFDSDLPFENNRTREVINFVSKNGNEVGLHGSFFSYTDIEILNKEKINLEKVTGNPIKGIRQHFLNLDVPHTWHIHEKVGFNYDTTLGYNDAIGFRAGFSTPFKPYDLMHNNSLNLWEIPLILMDVVLFREKPWLSLSAPEALVRSKSIIDKLKSFSGGASILWHLEYYEDERYTSTYDKLLKYIGDTNGWTTTCENLIDWWEVRNQIELAINYDNKIPISIKASLKIKNKALKLSRHTLAIDYYSSGKLANYEIPIKELAEKGEYIINI